MRGDEPLAEHILANCTPFFPFVDEARGRPAFELHQGTGSVVLCQRMARLADTGEGRVRGLLIVAQSWDGIMEVGAALPVSQTVYLDRQRVGTLAWRRD